VTIFSVWFILESYKLENGFEFPIYLLIISLLVL